MREWGTNLGKIINNPPRLKTRHAFCMWSDLLGFSNLYKDCNWNLGCKERRKVYDRLVSAHSAVLYYSQPNERNLILNDGMAKVYIPDDSILGNREFYKIAVYLRFCIELHLNINENEKERDLPGCRSVIAFGDCIEYLAEEVRFDDYVMNYTKPKGDAISSIAKEIGNPLVIYNPKELQMNTAFSKAFIIEGGKVDKRSTRKNNLYIDQSVIDAVIWYAKRNGFSSVWQESDDELRLMIPYEKTNLNDVVVGFAFDKNVMSSPEDCKYQSQVYKLLKLFPFDERVDEFFFDLRV